MNKVVEPKNGHSLDADNASLIIDLRGAYLHGTIIDLSGCNLNRIKIVTDSKTNGPIIKPGDVKPLPSIIPSPNPIKEEWAVVEGYGNRLEVSNTGFLRYSDTKRIVRTKGKTVGIQFKDQDGNVLHTNVSIPREVAKRFLPLPEGYTESDMDHFAVQVKDKNLGFAVTNLQWSCYSKVKVARGRRKCGVISYRIGEEPFTYDTILDAAKILGISYQKLSEKTRGGGVYVHDGGIHIRRADD